MNKNKTWFAALIAIVAVLYQEQAVIAFSLTGPSSVWLITETMVPARIQYLNADNQWIIGIDWSDKRVPDETQPLGEDFRWNTPTIVYGFDDSFLFYFGQEGVKAVEKGIAILNNLPPSDSLSRDVHEYPLQSFRWNYQALKLQLLDVKSYTLTACHRILGLARPDRHVWCLFGQTLSGCNVVQRNYDPSTYEPSEYVDGILYYYAITKLGEQTRLINLLRDPLAPDYSGIATPPPIGFYCPGLTRDDVGGIRYLYASSNLHNDALVEDCTIDTDASVSLFRRTGIRKGIDKIAWQRADYWGDENKTPVFNVHWNDVVSQGGIWYTQKVIRILTRPDVVFSAGVCNPTADGERVFLKINGMIFKSYAGSTNTDSFKGPGTISGPITVTFNTALGLINQTNAIQWGSFDGSTNAPVAYPKANNFGTINTGAIRKSLVWKLHTDGPEPPRVTEETKLLNGETVLRSPKFGLDADGKWWAEEAIEENRSELYMKRQNGLNP